MTTREKAGLKYMIPFYCRLQSMERCYTGQLTVLSEWDFQSTQLPLELKRHLSS